MTQNSEHYRGERTDYAYDTKGRLETVAYPNGAQGFLVYDPNTGQVTIAGYRKADSTLIYQDGFTYVPGTTLYQQITRTTPTSSETTAYTYDAYQRLESVTEPDGRKTVYTYDAFGNRTLETITNINTPNATGGAPKAYGTYRYRYFAYSNRLEAIDYQAPGTSTWVTQETLSYDTAGRIQTRTNTAGDFTAYTFDDRGLLTVVEITPAGQPSASTTIGYTYDGLGARKSKTVNGVTTYYLTAAPFGLSQVIAELTADQSTPTAVYVYGGNQQLVEEPNTDRGQDLYLLHDGIVGSVTHAFDRTQTEKNRYTYDAFGIPITATTTAGRGHYGYTGEQYEQETGLVYLRSRYYDPTLGRFISADPFWGYLDRPASQNRYVYVENNPVLFVDPLGLVVACGQHAAIVDTEKFPAKHMACVLIPDNPQDFLGNPMFDNRPYATVGGQSGFTFGESDELTIERVIMNEYNFGLGHLVSAPNFPGDDPSNLHDLQLVEPPFGVTDTQHIEAWLRVTGSYDNGEIYDLLPGRSTNGYNSNSYLQGAADAIWVTLPDFPGFRPGQNKPLPLGNAWEPAICPK